jgi:hypothetical protein
MEKVNPKPYPALDVGNSIHTLWESLKRNPPLKRFGQVVDHYSA